jgi:predicted dehydrogenase
LSGGGALIDIGHLAVDMVVWLLDRPLYWVHAMALTPSDKRVEQSVSVMAGFEPDILVNLTISYEAPMPSVQEEMSIYGSGGSIFTRRFRTKRSTMPPEVIEQFRNGEVRNISFTEGPDSSNPLDDFLQSIEKNAEILSDGKSNLRTVEFIDAAYRSIQEHKRINLRDR